MKLKPIESFSTTLLKERKFVPKSQYKGPFLELTEKDNKEIADCMTKIEKYEKRIREVENNVSISKGDRASRHLDNAICYLQVQIEKLRTQIRNIKENRMKIQRGEL